uniref:Histone H1 n=1 Tax=Aegilops tauschii TaxID=37682 RepID=M8BPN5_AEGTA
MSTDAAAADIPVPQVEATADPVVETTADAAAGDAKATKATKAKAKAAKTPKAKKPSAPRKPKATPAHPTYAEMVTEAIAALKERNGSSTVAIAKYIEDKHKAHLPANFRKFMLTQIKKLVAAGKLTKTVNFTSGSGCAGSIRRTLGGVSVGETMTTTTAAARVCPPASALP